MALAVARPEAIARPGELAAARAGAPKLHALTSLRFFAALHVVAAHYGQWVLPAGLLRGLAREGAVGVSFFFVLSGFILAYTYSSADGGGLWGRCRAFYVARFARVYPVYVLGLLVGIGPALWNPPSAWAPIIRIPVPVVVASSLTLTQSWIPYAYFLWNSPGWSLAAEAFFYLLFPLALARCMRLSTRALLLMVVSCWLLSIVIQEAYVILQPDGPAASALGYWRNVVFYNPLVRLPEFLLGVAVGRLFIYAHARNGKSLAGWRADLTAVVTLLLIAAGLLWIAPDHQLLILAGGIAPLFGLLIYVLAWGRGMLARLLVHPLLVLLGEASYALYIIHFPLWHVLARMASIPEGAAQLSRPFALLYLILTVVLALLTLRLVEEPARRAIRRRWG